MERYPAPLAKPPTIIYEKYLPTSSPAQPRQLVVRREICRPTGYPIVQQQMPGRHLVREIVRHIPQTQPTSQPALVCLPQQQSVQQFVPVFATRQVSFNLKNLISYLCSIKRKNK